MFLQTTDMPKVAYHVHIVCLSADFDGDGGWRWMEVVTKKIYVSQEVGSLTKTGI